MLDGTEGTKKDLDPLNASNDDGGSEVFLDVLEDCDDESDGSDSDGVAMPDLVPDSGSDVSGDEGERASAGRRVSRAASRLGLG